MLSILKKGYLLTQMLLNLLEQLMQLSIIGQLIDQRISKEIFIILQQPILYDYWSCFYSYRIRFESGRLIKIILNFKNSDTDCKNYKQYVTDMYKTCFQEDVTSLPLPFGEGVLKLSLMFQQHKLISKIRKNIMAQIKELVLVGYSCYLQVFRNHKYLCNQNMNELNQPKQKERKINKKSNNNVQSLSKKGEKIILMHQQRFLQRSNLEQPVTYCCSISITYC